MTQTIKTPSRKGRADEKDLALGHKLRVLRKERKLTLHDMAGLFGISAQQVQKYEMGEDRLSAVRLIELCKIFNFNLSQFSEAENQNEHGAMGFAESDQSGFQSPHPVLTTEEKKLLDLFRKIDDSKARNNVLQLIQNLIDAKR